MNKLFSLGIMVLLIAACSNNVKTKKEEEKTRDSIDNVVLDENQRFVDSLEKADAAKDSLKMPVKVK